MMNAWQIDPTHSATWTPEQRAGVKRATDIYNPGSAPCCRTSRCTYFCRAPTATTGTGMFYWSPSLKRGTLYIFRPNSDQKTMLVP